MNRFSRRRFLKTSATTAASASTLISAPRLHSGERNTLKVGLVKAICNYTYFHTDLH